MNKISSKNVKDSIISIDDMLCKVNMKYNLMGFGDLLFRKKVGKYTFKQPNYLDGKKLRFSFRTDRNFRKFIDVCPFDNDLCFNYEYCGNSLLMNKNFNKVLKNKVKEEFQYRRLLYDIHPKNKLYKQNVILKIIEHVNIAK